MRAVQDRPIVMGALDELLRDPRVRSFLIVAAQHEYALRTRNGAATPFAPQLIDTLTATADRPLVQAMSESGPTPCTLAGMTAGMVPAREAADMAGCSEVHARRLARAKKVRNFRAGPHALFIDPDSLRSVLRRAS
jgi:hypothetical protein